MIDFESRFENDSEKSTGFLFVRVYHQWHMRIKKELLQLGLTHPQFVILTSCNYLLFHKKQVTQALLSQTTEIDKATVSQIVVLLEKKGLLKREKNVSDQRANLVVLTSEGLKMVKKALPLVEQIDQEYFSILENDQGQFASHLKRLLTKKE